MLEQGRQAWETQDVDALIRLNDGAGFGRRARDARPALRSSPELRKALQAAFEAFDYARVVDIDGDVQVDGDTAILWGFLCEEFQRKGGDPETVRVRFTRVARKRNGEWAYIWGHRDIQAFD